MRTDADVFAFPNFAWKPFRRDRFLTPALSDYHDCQKHLFFARDVPPLPTESL